MSNAPTSLREVTTPHGFLSFPHLAEPDQYQGKGEPKFRAQLVVVSDEGGKTAREKLAPVVTALRQAAQEFFGGPELGQLMLPIGPPKPADAETWGDPTALVVKATGRARPILFNAYGDRIEDPENKVHHSQLFYPGAVVRFNCWAFGWDSGRKGVSLVLQAVQHVEDATPLGGSSSEVTMGAVRQRPAKAAPASWNPDQDAASAATYGTLDEPQPPSSGPHAPPADFADGPDLDEKDPLPF